ncbi:MAG TPA: hypothetical protein VI136_11340 [Verrucomicrobiae bacterium]
MKPTKLSELIEALEFDSDEHVTRVDFECGRVVMRHRSLLGAVEAGDAHFPTAICGELSPAVAPWLQ